MADRQIHERFLQIICSVIASGLVIILGLPVLAISALGECPQFEDQAMPNCLAGKRIELAVLTFGLIFLSALAGWLTYRRRAERERATNHNIEPFTAPEHHPEADRQFAPVRGSA
jgi:hypothetical protein